MDDTETALSHELRIFEHICSMAGKPLRRVDVVHGRISVQEGKDGDFRMWQERQNGGFRRFPRESASWTKSDVSRFQILLRSPSTFFVLLHEDNAQIFPSRSSLS